MVSNVRQRTQDYLGVVRWRIRGGGGMTGIKVGMRRTERELVIAWPSEDSRIASSASTSPVHLCARCERRDAVQCVCEGCV